MPLTMPLTLLSLPTISLSPFISSPLTLSCSSLLPLLPPSASSVPQQERGVDSKTFLLFTHPFSPSPNEWCPVFHCRHHNVLSLSLSLSLLPLPLPSSLPLAAPPPPPLLLLHGPACYHVLGRGCSVPSFMQGVCATPPLHKWGVWVSMPHPPFTPHPLVLHKLGSCFAP
jgi:hypothetical protein